MATENQEEKPWPDEFVLRGGRLFNRMYPDAVFRRVHGDPPERQCFTAKWRESMTIAEWRALSAREKRKYGRPSETLMKEEKKKK